MTAHEPAALRPTDLSPLLAAAQGGDEEAFRGLYRAVQPGLLRYLRALLGDDAEDVASETWLQVARDIRTFRGKDEFRAWVARIGRNRAMDHLRYQRRRPAVSTPIEDLVELPAVVDTADSASDSISTDAALALIRTLPRDQAEAVLLRVVVGLDAETTGKVLGKRAGAVRTASYRGLRRLAESLDQLSHPHDQYAGPAVTPQGVTDASAKTPAGTR
ncbi:RNA polymerase sigma factor [Planosporangium mesophilum]|uniref:DNA-directed RNA polymerase sigma-70 factor n=1 Tax=Planosporangium mesophilum TaxID=689768 RepID=A0A8J3X2R3_9ACTN|nr:RNA polymerase sigma factor [Planosporangium mesophilum]GII25777.1 DNA-directed RNA polymerase sigma-70 factor [Planosporangium mesophilum]